MGRTTKKKRARTPESDILKQARLFSSQTGIQNGQYMSIRPNGTSFPSVNQPFKPVVAVASTSGPVQIRPMMLMQNYKSAAKQKENEEEEDSEDEISEDEEDDETMTERASKLPHKVKTINCEMSPLQKELHEAVNGLMTLSEEEQQKYNAELVNHPSLLFMRIQERAGGGHSHCSGKKARQRFENYYGVLCKFPTRYQPDHLMVEIKESGKLVKLVEILTAAAEGDNEERPAQLLVASSSLRTLDMLEQLMETINPLLNYSIYRINPNMASTVRNEFMVRVLGDRDRKLILLNVKTEHLPRELFSGAQLIFYDFDRVIDAQIVANLDDVEVRSIQRLVTLGTFEAE